MACANVVTGRRNLLGALATLAAASAVPAVSLAAEQDPHPAWWAESSALIDLINGPAPEGLTMEEEDAPVAWQDEQYGDLFDRIVETPARTLAGVQAQLAVALFCAESWEGDRNEPVVAALKSAAVTLEQLAGRA